jgi:hypothetical protein
MSFTSSGDAQTAVRCGSKAAKTIANVMQTAKNLWFGFKAITTIIFIYNHLLLFSDIFIPSGDRR